MFLKYLKDHNYSIFWTVLAEKRIIANRDWGNRYYKHPHISGVYTIDENGKLKGDTNTFEE